MPQAKLSILALSAALSLGIASASESTGPPTGQLEPAVWQHHQELISYFGVTASYTCTGIEDRMRELLGYLGARQDLKVTPLCANQSAPMQQVFVRVDFYSLAPAAAGATGEVSAHWVPLEITPRDALFRDRGDCELFFHVKDMLTKDFTVRNVQYVTNCTPHQTTLQDYKIAGELLAAESLHRKS
jgi:hypothetical protein